jgi:3-hydroxybutyryl-CoA dehydrogenase
MSAAAVVGAGTMGAGIGVALGMAGIRTTIVGRREEGLERARRQVDASLDLLASHGRATDAAGRIELSTGLRGAVAGAELVVETIVEDLDAKRRLLAEVSAAASPEAIIATNTSSLSLEALAGSVTQPQRFAGMHWFNPPELVELVELAPAPQTAPATIERLRGWALAAGKRPIQLTRTLPGLVANRLQYALIREAYALVDAGVCDLDAIDTAVTAGLGPRWAAVGPFESMDLAGLDVHLSVAQELFPLLSDECEAPAMLRDAVADGRLGAKSGDGLRGVYDGDRLAVIASRRACWLLRG